MPRDPISPLTDRDKLLLEKCKEAVLILCPEASLTLYGSRARGDAEEDSDYDLFILTPEPMTKSQKKAIAQSIYQIDLYYDVVISDYYCDAEKWASRRRDDPFFSRVDQEGIAL